MREKLSLAACEAALPNLCRTLLLPQGHLLPQKEAI